MVDSGLLGELPLGHLLGLELSSQPLIERSTVLAGHRWAGRSLLAAAAIAALSSLSGAWRPLCITRSYRNISPVGRDHGPIGAVRCGACGSTGSRALVRSSARVPVSSRRPQLLGWPPSGPRPAA